MDLFTVSTEEYRDGIYFKKLAALKDALALFGAEVRAAYMSELFDDIDEQLPRRNWFTRDFEYNDEGPFARLRIRVYQPRSGGYLLSVRSMAYGEAPEPNLAHKLGVEQALLWTRVVLTLDDIEGDRFSIDFNPIADRLRRASKTPVNGEDIATVIGTGVKRPHSALTWNGGTFVVREGRGSKPAIKVVMEESSVVPFYSRPWQYDGSVLTAGLRRYDERTLYEHPRVLIYVHSEQERDLIGHPIATHYPWVKAQVRATTMRLKNSMDP